MQETRVQSLGQEDLLEKEMATHSSILAWRIPWTEEPGGLQSTGSHRVGHDWVTWLYLLQIHRWHHPYRENEEELRSLLLKVKEESEKVALKLNIQKTKITASGPITWWQIDGETMETAKDFILGGSKITADGHCSHEIKRCLLLERKVMINLDSLLKNRDITLTTKVCLVKAMTFQ